MARTVSVCVVAAAASLVALASAGAQVRRGVVTGVVSDSTGRAIVGARVEIVDTDIRATTEADGRYLLPGVWPGRSTMRIRRVGFAAETLGIVVTAGDTSRADVRMGALGVALPATQIGAAPASGKMSGFDERRARGVGAFITRAEIDRWQSSSVSELLRHLPGVAVTEKRPGEPQGVRMERSTATGVAGLCNVQLYVDGHPYPGGSVDDFTPDVIEGIEVYRSASEIPGSFRTRDAACGIIGIWTRDPGLARRRP